MKILSPLHPLRSQRLKQYIKHLPGLVAYYPLNETAGATAYNKAPATLGTLNGTTTGATIGQAGQVGRSYSFDGVGDRVDFTAGITRTAGQPFSAFTMFKTALTDQYVYILGIRNGSGAGDLWKIGVSNSAFKYEYDSTGNGGTVTPNPAVTFNDSRWHMAVLVYDGSSIKGYFDGADVNGTVTDRPNAAIDQTLGAIGCNAATGDETFTGFAQHCGYLTRALSAAEILKLARIGGVA